MYRQGDECRLVVCAGLYGMWGSRVQYNVALTRTSSPMRVEVCPVRPVGALPLVAGGSVVERGEGGNQGEVVRRVRGN